ncbi:Acyl-CoA-binding domain-containing protein 1 [Mortierella alpina]|nr:Acyl-CoA-binding domain-containing protein 1 [Mortierella alpina]
MPSAEFDAAAAKAKTLKDATNDQLLKLYGLFKQATIGDCNTSRPGMFDPKGGYKWDAWNEKKGLSQADAEKQYIAYVESLFA